MSWFVESPGRFNSLVGKYARRFLAWFARVWATGRPPTRWSELPHRGPPHDNVRVSSFPASTEALTISHDWMPMTGATRSEDLRRWRGELARSTPGELRRGGPAR